MVGNATDKSFGVVLGTYIYIDIYIYIYIYICVAPYTTPGLGPERMVCDMNMFFGLKQNQSDPVFNVHITTLDAVR